MSYHPEQTADEVFVGNTRSVSGIPSHLSGLKTARLGRVAYDLDGKKIANDYMLPLLIGKEEAAQYDRIMMARLSAASRGGQP